MLRALALLALLALSLPGCARDKGAVLVRWRLVDSSTGQGPVSCSLPEATRQVSVESKLPGGGACCAQVKSQRLGTIADVIIDHIRLRVQKVASVDQVEVMDAPCPSCCTSCSLTEHTTEFELDEGDYKLWIEALRCGVPVGQTPPAVVRHVTAGEITNLNSIEVRVDPETTSPTLCAGGGGTSNGCTAIGGASDGGADAAAILDGSAGGG